MIRIVFLVLWILPFLQPSAQGAIEIFANGHKYNSLQEYLRSKKSAVTHTPKHVSSNSRQKVLRREDQQDRVLHQLYVQSIENGVISALQDFYESRGFSNLPITRKITLEQLQETIQQAVTTSNGPKLLISESGKVRIMSISPNASGQ